jgi:tripartite-type tricarboxylate transporter receptor subunit TctC
MLKKCVASLALMMAIMPMSAQADTPFPNKAVRIIVPQTPGGASDALARLVAQKLGAKWGQPVIVENRPGAGGNIGMDLVATAPSDGHTLLMTYVGTQAINGSLYKKLSFNPVTDFSTVATVATLPFVLVSRKNAPFQNVQELINIARDGRVTYGSAGNGSVNHLLGEMFNADAKVKLTHVPYKGAAPAIQDLFSGQIDVVFTSLPSVAGQLKAGNLRALAVTSAQRAKAFAQVPSIAESGISEFDVNPWFGLVAPKNTSKKTVQKINTDVNEILHTQDVIAGFEAIGAEPYASTPEAFSQQLQSDAAKWSDVVKRSGAKLD